ncbi:MAG: hypothetical protein H7X88_09040, partial [Gloeobacteraceae cyanobacterium ES-bin-316]|nr:hypothetical protein [Ferruginibacter sp.]
MKKILIMCTAVVIAATMSFAPGDPLTIGTQLPKADLKMQDVTGKM